MNIEQNVVKPRLVKRFAIVLTTVVFCCISSFAQNEKLPFFKKVTHPFMPPITSEYFFFSEDGLMWFSTAQGLTSFDGSEISFYSSIQQANELGLNRIGSIEEDNNHDFYLATQHGLCFYERKSRNFRMLTYIFTDIGKHYDIDFAPLYRDNDGSIYAGSKSNGLFIYYPHSKKFLHFNLDPNKNDSWEDYRLNTVASFAKHATDSNKLWVGTYHGIYLFDKKNKTFERRFELINPGHSLPGSAIPEHYDIQKMEVENDSIIWFNSWTGGIGKYNTHTGKVKLFLHDARIKTPEQSVGFVMPKFGKLGNNQYLLGIYDDKTAIFNSLTEKVTYFRVTETNFPEEQTRFVTRDKHGNLWLLQKGAIYVKLPDSLHLQSVTIPHIIATSFQKPVIRGIFFDTSSHLFYTALSGSIGVHVYDTNFVQRKVIPTGLIHNYFILNSTLDIKISKDGSDRFWTIGWENFLLTPDAKKFEFLEKKIPSLKWLKVKGEPWDITTTRNGNILFKINGALIYHINHLTLAVDTIRCPKMNPDKTVIIKDASVWYDGKRDFVYLTRDEGIAQYNLTTNRMRIIPNTSLFGNLPPNEGVCAPALDASGRICFMIPKYGIRIINPQSLDCIDSIQYGTKGLMRGDYTSVIGGNNNYLLLRSQNGIVVYDFVKQQSFLFDQSNGLSSPDNKVFLYCNGHLIVSQAGQFDYYKLSGLDNYSTTVTPHLNSILFDTVAVYTKTALENNQIIKLTHDQNTLSFSFSAPEFFFPERIEYAYQLIPVDNDWHYTNYFNRKIIYTKLSPGSYSFRLKAQMQGGNWNSPPIEYKIIIKPAWWQTKLFIVLLLILILVIIILISRWRIRNIRRQEREKGQMEKQMLELEAKALRAQMNPHFIFNCLNSIKALIQQHDEKKSVTYLTTFSKLIRTLFNNADKKEISLYDEIETCKLYLQLEAMRFDTKFSYAVNVNENIDLKSVQVPAMIVQPFIENAIWHGIVSRNNGGHVSFNVQRKDGAIEIVIDDNGIGREASHQNKSVSSFAHQSKGVNLTQSRLELDNLLKQRQAKLEIIDKKDEKGISTGTKVIISIKEEI